MRRSAALLLVPVLAASALGVVRGGREAGWQVLPDGTRVREEAPWLLDRVEVPLGLGMGAEFRITTEIALPPAATDRARADLRRLDEAVLRFYFAEGRVPEKLAELERPDPNGTPYVEAIPRDPWGRAYVYDPRPSIRTVPTYRLSCRPLGRGGAGLSIISNAEAFTSDR